MNIYLYNQDIGQLNTIHKTVESLIVEKQLDMHIMTATHDMAIYLDTIRETPYRNLHIITSLKVGNVECIELGKRIREQDIDAYLILISDKPETTYLAFENKLNLSDSLLWAGLYMKKHMIENSLTRIAIMDQKEQRKYCYVKSKGQTIKIAIHQIISIKHIPYSKFCEIRTTESVYEIKVSLKAILEQLDSRFFKCNQSLVINTAFIQQYDKKEQILQMLDQSAHRISVKASRRLKVLLKRTE